MRHYLFCPKHFSEINTNSRQRAKKDATVVHEKEPNDRVDHPIAKRVLHFISVYLHGSNFVTQIFSLSIIKNLYLNFIIIIKKFKYTFNRKYIFKYNIIFFYLYYI